MKNNYKYIAFFSIAIILFSLTFGFINGYGQELDPLVTQSYVEMRIDQIKDYIDQKVNEISSKSSTSNTTDVEKYIKFVPVELKLGEELIGGEGSEIVLRAGNARSVVSTDGGLLDVTSGVDLDENEDIPKDHLLIVPRDDGRGIRITNAKAFAMVKGPYDIK